jgi:hypothetical protein
VIDDPSVQAKIDALMSTYNYEVTRAREELVAAHDKEDRIQESYAGRYDETKEQWRAERRVLVCADYKSSRAHTYDAQVAARDINVLRPNAANLARLNTERSNMEYINMMFKGQCG